MNKGIFVFSLLFAALTFFSPDVSSQYIYSAPAVKKITKKQYHKLLKKQQLDKQNKNRPFVYQWI